MTNPLTAFTPLLILLICLVALELAALVVLVWRVTARRVLDPLGLDARVNTLSERMGAVERYQATLAQKTAEMEQRLFDRLGEVAAQQTKVLAHMTAVESIVASEQRDRRETTTRIDGVMSALTNIGQRFGRLEDGLRLVLDARPGSIE